MSLQVFKDKIVDTVGVLAIGHTAIANITEILLGVNWNVVSLFITTLLSIVFLWYRIRETRKTNELRQLEIERERLNLEKIKEEIKNINIKRIDIENLKSILKK